MPEINAIDWQALYRQRQDIADRFGEIWALPLDKRYHRVLSRSGKAGIAMLEIGAGDRALREKMRGYWGNYNYASCDIDATHQHDFRGIAEISGSYDLVCAFELIEHLSLPEAFEMLLMAHKVLKPGGRLVMTTPNIFYPPAFLRDATHRTPFCYDEFGGISQLAGFRVIEMYRLHHDSLVKKFLKRYLLYPLYRILGIDFAKQIILVAEKV